MKAIDFTILETADNSRLISRSGFEISLDRTNEVTTVWSPDSTRARVGSNKTVDHAVTGFPEAIEFVGYMDLDHVEYRNVYKNRVDARAVFNTGRGIFERQIDVEVCLEKNTEGDVILEVSSFRDTGNAFNLVVTSTIVFTDNQRTADFNWDGMNGREGGSIRREGDLSDLVEGLARNHVIHWILTNRKEVIKSL